MFNKLAEIQGLAMEVLQDMRDIFSYSQKIIYEVDFSESEEEALKEIELLARGIFIIAEKYVSK